MSGNRSDTARPGLRARTVGLLTFLTCFSLPSHHYARTEVSLVISRPQVKPASLFGPATFCLACSFALLSFHSHYNSVDNTSVTIHHHLISHAGWNRCNLSIYHIGS